MERQHPELEQIERYLQALPASLEGPDAQRLESILHRTKNAAPRNKTLLRTNHRIWWLLLALTTGMATAAIWHQVRKMRIEPEQAVQITPPPVPKQEGIAPSSPSHADEGETPLSRPDRRFIPK
jgi:hypothetical protein